MIMAKLRVVSWNVRGLNSKIKRSLMFEYLARHNAHMILQQETHLHSSLIVAIAEGPLIAGDNSDLEFFQ